MAESSSGGNSFLGFIVGALLVVVLVVGFFAYRGGAFGGNEKTLNLKVEAPQISAPKVPNAG